MAENYGNGTDMTMSFAMISELRMSFGTSSTTQ